MSFPAVQLLPLHLRDAPVMAQLANNRQIWDNVRDYFPHPYTLTDAYDFIAFCQQQQPVQNFAIWHKSDWVGVIGLVLQKDVNRFTAEIGYWIGESYWGQGIGTEAIQQICRYAFEDLKLLRLYAHVFEFNQVSMRVLEKAGFHLESKAPWAYIKNNQVGTEHRYVRLNPHVTFPHNSSSYGI
jgi:[ribosomal protein S5]-alanine N-acetyltransferase